ncbi:MAG: zinc ABC transporter substrate-binding protein [Deltaproteobacteria bacterium]|nr:MAG: zinc ABC transporter substrate-binding protein [Deltaproteobacteria bacterium]
MARIPFDLAVILAAALLIAARSADAKLDVVATTPDLGAVAMAVGGDKVSVLALAKPTEDPHFVDARPSHVVKLNRADALIEGGAELEIGWLPPLLEGARNPKIAAGAPGRIVASEGIQLVDVPASVDRSKGDLHALGNPHFMLDPLNAKVVATHIADAFCRLDAPDCTTYRANLSRFTASIDRKMQDWGATLAPFAGSEIVTYHVSWRYFAQRFDLKTDTFLEPKPGIPPSPPHLAEVIGKMNAEHIRAILVEPFQQRKVADAVASHTGASIAPVAQFPGAFPGTDNDYIALVDADVKAIAQALGTAH